jgi:hypothetical protein
LISRLALLCVLALGCGSAAQDGGVTHVVVTRPKTSSTTAPTIDAAAADVEAPPPPAVAEKVTPPSPTDDGYELSDQAYPRPFGALCLGPWRGVGELHPYRGVRVENNGGGECCPLAGRAFVCVIMPGHQHEQFVYEHARFFDGASTTPRVSLPVTVLENQGMAVVARPIVHLEAVNTSGGFLLRPDAGVCLRPTPSLRDVCKAAGQYTWRNAIPVRLP